MPKQLHIKPRAIIVHGREHWRVIVPVDLRGDGPERRYFESRSQALEFGRTLQELRSSAKTQLLLLSDPDQTRLLNCLKSAGNDLRVLEEAVAEYQRRRPYLKHSRSVKLVIEECLLAKENANVRHRYLIGSVLDLFGKR